MSAASVDQKGDKKITRQDIEARLRALRGEADETARAALPRIATIGAVVTVAIIGAAYLLGRRSGRKRSAVVEIRRL